MSPPSLRKAALVAALAATAWFAPLLWTLARHKQSRAERSPGALPPPLPGAVKPLLLYVEAWPTRAKLDLREIQGLTNESESSIAPPRVAETLYAELGELGITPEIHRIDRLPPAFDLANFKPVVFIYPARHGRPAPEVTGFFDRQVERFIAKHHGPAQLAFTDVVVAETPADAAAAQAALQAMNRYYGVPFRVGPQLTPQMTVAAEEDQVAAQAAAIRKEVAQ